MSSDRSFVDHVCEQSGLVPGLSARAMFGEYGLYLDGKLIASICDDQLFVKPTPAGRRSVPAALEAPPYPGAKSCLVVDEAIDAPDLLRSLFVATADAMPAPKRKAVRVAATRTRSTT